MSYYRDCLHIRRRNFTDTLAIRVAILVITQDLVLNGPEGAEPAVKALCELLDYR